MAVWESWEARETMVMSMSSLESPLEADPVILMSFLRCVPVIQGSRWTTKLVQNTSMLWQGTNDASTRPRTDHSGLSSYASAV
jgi:glutaredoxin 2